MTRYSEEIGSNETLKKFIVDFYEQSDRKPNEEIDKYLDFFTPTATVIMASTTYHGNEEIARLRMDLWRTVTQRCHVVENVARICSSEFLVTGYVEYTLINGKSLKVDWSGHLIFENEALDKMRYYQVYLDTSPSKEATKS